MLEKVDLEKALSKEEYKARLPALEQRLFELQTACWREHVASVIVFEGWETAGKGTTINALTQRLEPRGFRLHAIQAPRTYETHMPWMWRFWQRLPNYGEMAIFDQSWYRRVLVKRVEKLLSKEEWTRAYDDINDFERAIADDGYAVVKFFLHIDRREQAKRLKALEKDPLLSWQVQDEDWAQNRKYGKYLQAAEDMLQRTETEWAPWTIVEATDKRWTRIKVCEAMIARLERALEEHGKPLPPAPPPPEPPARTARTARKKTR